MLEKRCAVCHAPKILKRKMQGAKSSTMSKVREQCKPKLELIVKLKERQFITHVFLVSFSPVGGVSVSSSFTLCGMSGVFHAVSEVSKSTGARL